MVKTFIYWLVAIGFTAAATTSFAAKQQVQQSPEKFMGSWDRNAGIVSLFVKEIDHIKQARMVVADEYIENARSKLSFTLTLSDLDDFGDMLDNALEDLIDAEKRPVPELRTPESAENVGQLIYPNGIFVFNTVSPAGTQKYTTMVVTSLLRKDTFVFWMEKADLKTFKKLITKTQNELSEQ